MKLRAQLSVLSCIQAGFRSMEQHERARSICPRPPALADRPALCRSSHARGRPSAAEAVVRVLSAPYRRAGKAALGMYRATGPARPALRIRHLWRRRQHPGPHPFDRRPLGAGNRADARRPPYLRRRDARGSGRRRSAILGRGGTPHRRLARRSRPRHGLCPASRRLCICRRSGGRPAEGRGFRDLGCRLPGNPPLRAQPRGRSRQS